MAAELESLGAGREGVNDPPDAPPEAYPRRGRGNPRSTPGPAPAATRGAGTGGGGSAERIGILGGSFDPVHAGHLFVARSARGAFGLDRVLFVPAARPPHKPGRRLASAEHRLAMLEIATDGEPAFEVRDLELRRAGPSYTIDTVRALSAEFPRAELFLVIGEDNLRGLPEWREVEELLRRVRPIVVRRRAGEADAREVLAELAGRLSPAALERLAEGWLEVPPHPASSTDLRARLGRGEDPGDLLPPGVARYALAHRLYGDGAAAAGEEGRA